MRVAIALLVALASVVTGASSAAAHGGGVSTFGAGPASAHKLDGRSFFAFDSSVGGRGRDHIAVINLTHHKETLDVYTVDAASTSDGSFSYAPKAAKRTGAGAWLAVGTPKASGIVTMRPRSTTILPLRLRVPSNAPPGDHAAGVIVSLTALVKTKGKTSQHVDLEQRIATRVLVRVSGKLVPQLSVTGLHASYSGKFFSFGSGAATVRYTVRNTGNVILGGAQQVTVTGLFGTTSAGPKLPTIPPLLPGAGYPVTVHVPDVFPELLETAKVRIQPEGLVGDVNPELKPVAASSHFWAIPWLIIIVLLVLLLIIIVEITRRRRRSREAARLLDAPEPQGVSA